MAPPHTGCAYLIAAYYPKGWKAESAWLADQANHALFNMGSIKHMLDAYAYGTKWKQLCIMQSLLLLS